MKLSNGSIIQHGSYLSQGAQAIGFPIAFLAFYTIVGQWMGKANSLGSIKIENAGLHYMNLYTISPNGYQNNITVKWLACGY